MTENFKAKRGGLYSRPQLSPENYAERKKAEKESVYKMLDDIAVDVVHSPEKFKGYLDVQSRMDRYTANNALLMYRQFPQASYIKDFNDWVAEGVKVNKGAKTFIILDPYEYTKNDGTLGISFNLKRVLDISQTNGRKPVASMARDPRQLATLMLDISPVKRKIADELPFSNTGAFYNNEDQTLYVKRNFGDAIALCQHIAKELGHAELAMNYDEYIRSVMDFHAVCIGYMLCKKYGVSTPDLATPNNLKNKDPKEIRAELGRDQKALNDIVSLISNELYRQKKERSKEQER